MSEATVGRAGRIKLFLDDAKSFWKGVLRSLRKLLELTTMLESVMLLRSSGTLQ